MRIIKFRGKDVKTSHWVYGGFHEHIDITPAAIYKDAESRENHIKEHTRYLIMQDAFSDYCMPRKIQCFDVTSETIGQFTGLYDKNGKEIYEGDVIGRHDLEIKYLIFYNEKEGRFMAALNGDIEGYFVSACGLDNSCWIASKEVIGNIHDNPELLK